MVIGNPVDGEDLRFLAFFKDNASAFAAEDIDPVPSRDGGSIDGVNRFQPFMLEIGLAGLGVKARENGVVSRNKVKQVAYQQG